MIKTKVKVSLTRMLGDTQSVRLEITDAYSGNRIMEIETTPESLGLLITGIGRIEMSANFYEKAKIAQQGETKRMCIPLEKSYLSEDEIKRRVDKHLSENNPDGGWEVHSYGTGSQQNKADSHTYIAIRYRPIEIDK